MLPDLTFASLLLSSDIKISSFTEIVNSLELLSNKTLMVFEELNSELLSELNLFVEEHPKKISKNKSRKNLRLEVFEKGIKIVVYKNREMIHYLLSKHRLDTAPGSFSNTRNAMSNSDICRISNLIIIIYNF